MFDWQLFTQRSTATVAHSERKKFTGHVECRVFYRNSKPRRSAIRKLNCPVLNVKTAANRETLLLPAEIIRGMESELPKDGLPNEDCEISVIYYFFLGSVVDTRTELIQHL